MRRYIKFSVYLFCAVLTLGGYTITLFVAHKQLLFEAEDHASFIQLNIDKYINEANLAYDIGLRRFFPNFNCNTFLPAARKQVFYQPHIRSITVIHNNQFICSTAVTSRALGQRRPASPELLRYPFFYFDHSPYSNYSGVVLFSLNAQGYHVFFGINPIYIRELISKRNPYYQAYIHVGNMYFNQNSQPVSQINLATYTAIKGHYVDVYYRLSFWLFLQFFWINYYGDLVIWTAFSVLLSLYIYHVASRFDWRTLGINRALKQHQFVPYLQAVFDENQQLCGCEVLARWEHPQKGIILPYHFIHSAEQSGQIDAIFHILMNKVLSVLSEIEPFAQPFQIGFNISAPQLLRSALFADCEHFIAEAKAHNCQLAIELTERIQIPSEEPYLSALKKLRDMGAVMALDDFGTGHCTLSYLTKMKIDYLKIDKRYVDYIDDLEHRKLLENIIDLAQRLNIPMVAEGIEHLYQYRYLVGKGVDGFQGFLFEKPLDIDTFCHKYLRAIPSAQESIASPIATMLES